MVTFYFIVYCAVKCVCRCAQSVPITTTGALLTSRVLNVFPLSQKKKWSDKCQEALMSILGDN